MRCSGCIEVTIKIKMPQQSLLSFLSFFCGSRHEWRNYANPAEYPTEDIHLFSCEYHVSIIRTREANKVYAFVCQKVVLLWRKKTRISLSSFLSLWYGRWVDKKLFQLMSSANASLPLSWFLIAMSVRPLHTVRQVGIMALRFHYIKRGGWALCSPCPAHS